MTTPQQQPETIESTERTGSSADGAPSPERTETTGSAADSSTRDTESSDRHSGASARESLFPEHELSSMHSRWADVQAAFVDDPRECVQKADSLVTDLVERLTAGFAEARSRLEEQWAQGEEVSTENLRIALKRYRDFFERLLGV